MSETYLRNLFMPKIIPRTSNKISCYVIERWEVKIVNGYNSLEKSFRLNVHFLVKLICIAK